MATHGRRDGWRGAARRAREGAAVREERLAAARLRPVALRAVAGVGSVARRVLSPACVPSPLWVPPVSVPSPA